MRSSRLLAPLLAALLGVPLSVLPASAGPELQGPLASLPAPVRAALDASERAELLSALPARSERARQVSVAAWVDGSLVVDSFSLAAADAPRAAALLAKQPSVVAASPAFPVSASADAYRGHQWALDALRAESVRPLLSSSSPVVAVVDSGVDATHPELDGVLVPGVDLVSGSSVPVDPNGHGTHVAGIVGAELGDGVGVEGFLPAARLMPVRVLGADGSGSTATVAEGIVWAVDHGASVVNLSLGTTSDDPVVAAAVSYAESRGVVVVAAMGNSGEKGSPVEYPGAYPSVLAVAATTKSGTRAAFSSRGAHVDLAAPGAYVLSTYLQNSTFQGYGFMDGTSMAAPYVAASAAALRSRFPSLTPDQVRSHLLSTATDLGPVGPDDEFGAGLVDPFRALSTAPSEPAPTEPAPSEPAPTEPSLTEPAPVVEPAPEPAPAPEPVAPSAPAFTDASPGNASVALTWSAPTESGSHPLDGYRLTVQAGGALVRTLDLPVSSSYTVTGLTNGTAYTFSLQARSGAGLSSASAARTATPRTVPSAPTLAAATPGNVSVRLTWSAPTSTGGAPLSGYRVATYRGTTLVKVNDVPVSSGYTVTGLVNGTAYTFRVQARNVAGLSPASAARTATPRTVPSAPRYPRTLSGVYGDGRVSVTATWAAPSSTGGAPVSGYEVRLQRYGYTSVSTRLVSASARSSVFSSLAAGRSYRISVRARNAAGAGPWSAWSAYGVAR